MEAVKEFTYDFLNATGLSYAYYKRTYAKQSLCFSTHDAVPLGAIFDKVLPTIVKKGVTSTHLFDFLWDEYFSPQTIAMLEENHSLFHGLTTLRFYRTHYETFAVAHNEKNPLSASFYLCHLQLIHDFQEQLTKHMNVLAKRQKSPATLILDPSDPHKDIVMQDAINNEETKDFETFILDTQQKYALYDAFGQTTHLTALEFLSVHLFSQGKSYKTIALLLALSPRTVETYMTRAKERTGYANKYDILHAVRCFKITYCDEKDAHKINQFAVD